MRPLAQRQLWNVKPADAGFKEWKHEELKNLKNVKK